MRRGLFCIACILFSCSILASCGKLSEKKQQYNTATERWKADREEANRKSQICEDYILSDEFKADLESKGLVLVKRRDVMPGLTRIGFITLEKEEETVRCTFDYAAKVDVDGI